MEPMLRNSIDIVSRQVNENKKKVKNASGVLRKLAKKYMVVLKIRLLRILLGKSHSIADTVMEG